MTKDIEFVKVESSNIEQVGYDNEDSVLFVEYKGGARYSYSKVPQKIYVQLLEAESVGRFMNEEIKGTYDCEKL